MGLKFVEDSPSLKEMNEDYDVVLDALFGFSFKPPIRENFVEVVKALSDTKTPVASVDVPSGKYFLNDFFLINSLFNEILHVPYV